MGGGKVRFCRDLEICHPLFAGTDIGVLFVEVLFCTEETAVSPSLSISEHVPAWQKELVLGDTCREYPIIFDQFIFGEGFYS